MVKRYLGTSRVAEVLGLTATRVYQLRQSDPDFPPPAIELEEVRRGARQGWSEEDIRAYGNRRQARGGS
jgi:predicted DNA-binding transcriptional regulator AlpA